MGMSNYKSLLHKVRGLVFDYDGVLTDGKVFLLPDGNMMRQANVRDGFVLKHAFSEGFPIAIITGGTSDAVRLRFEFLGIKDVFIGVKDKEEVLANWMNEHGLSYSEVLYMGDDIPDLSVMQKVILPCCPADASEEVKRISAFISSRKGGEGCVREVVEQVLKIHGKWPW
jgi:3-deoxy-D-manno-octulosonate 8-phosphate phosphatase (KDO 8-P phosphatase)